MSMFGGGGNAHLWFSPKIVYHPVSYNSEPCLHLLVGPCQSLPGPPVPVDVSWEMLLKDWRAWRGDWSWDLGPHFHWLRPYVQGENSNSWVLPRLALHLGHKPSSTPWHSPSSPLGSKTFPLEERAETFVTHPKIEIMALCQALKDRNSPCQTLKNT